MNYFIMMNSQCGSYILPITQTDEYDNQEVKLFNTLEEAQESVKHHYYCQQFGYEIFERGTGEQ